MGFESLRIDEFGQRNRTLNRGQRGRTQEHGHVNPFPVDFGTQQVCPYKNCLRRLSRELPQRGD